MSLVLDDPGTDGARGPTEWVLIDRVLLRADEVRDDDRTVQVTARVGSADVVAALEALRPGVVRRPERRVTWSGTSVAGRQTTVSVTPLPNGWRVVFSVTRPTQAGWRELPGSVVTTTTGTYSGDQRAQRTLRRILFGEPMPREPFGISEALGDFTSELPSEGGGEDSYVAAFRLLLTEALVASGTALRVTEVVLSPPGPAGRAVRISWVSAVQARGGPRLVTVEGTWHP